MAEAWKEENLKRIKDWDSVEKAKKILANHDPKEPNKPEWKRENEARIAAFDAKRAKAKATPRATMPKSTTPDMDTSKGSIGSASGEVGPNMGARNIDVAEAAPERGSMRIKASEDDTPLRESSTQTGEDAMDSARRIMGGMKKGGKVKCMSSGGSTASRRGDGIATRGKTKGRIC
jgi:hypothetical protein